jgi:RND family efflux transporter MFP subunit
MKGCLPKILVIVGLLVLLGISWRLYERKDQNADPRGRGGSGRAIPVETAELQFGRIDDVRIFSGTLEASAQVAVSAKVVGRVLNVSADLGDQVQRGQILLELEADEFEQDVARAQAELAVAQAQLTEAENRLEIAARERDRMQQLRDQNISSDAELDNAKAEFLIRSSALEVAKAMRTARESDLQTAQLHLQETKVRAHWAEGKATRLIASREVEEGDLVTLQDRLFTVVEIEPLRALVFVPERDYGRLRQDQEVTLTTDAWPGRNFTGHIERIAPVFMASSRQARVEILVENQDQALKPGMFVRAAISLDHADHAVLVPEPALTRRGDRLGLFRVSDENTAVWTEVETGIANQAVVQILSPELSGRVVTLGQQLLDDGSPLILPEAAK